MSKVIKFPIPFNDNPNKATDELNKRMIAMDCLKYSFYLIGEMDREYQFLFLDIIQKEVNIVLDFLNEK